mmetsp:Transcript_45113/g.116682  ORF Transcript_45113/g.116682 Transcript_45113/m.116682 type:complete len:312 (-) Transcript_45113:153-1088(-)
MADVIAPYNSTGAGRDDAREMGMDDEESDREEVANDDARREEEQLRRMEMAVEGELNDEQLRNAGAPAGEGEGEAGEGETKKRKSGPRPTTLHPEKLTDPEKGLSVLTGLFPRSSFDTKQHSSDKGKIAAAKHNLNALFRTYQKWGQQLAPRLSFEDLMMKTEKLSAKQQIRSYLEGLRHGTIATPIGGGDDDRDGGGGGGLEDMGESGATTSIFGGVTGAPSPVPHTTPTYAPPSAMMMPSSSPSSQPPFSPSPLSPPPAATTTQPATPLTDEQKKMIEEKRRKAMERRQQRMSQLQSQSQSQSQPLSQS